MIVTRKEACNLMSQMLDTDIKLEGNNLEKVIYAVNTDMQVRDWLMGMPCRYDMDECMQFVQYMSTVTTKEDSVPFITVQAMFMYEQGEVEKSTKLLNYAASINNEYSLTKLLDRVITAGWPTSSFKTMREQLDPVVIEECSGERGDLVIGADE